MRLLVLAITGLALSLPAAGQSTNPPAAVDTDARIRAPNAAPSQTGKQPSEPKGITWQYQDGGVKDPKAGKPAPGR